MGKVLIISGPTATGKTALAEYFAKKYQGELISVDSRQIYKGLDIGTGKDHSSKTKIHLIDLITPNEKFSAFDFAKQANLKIQEIQSRGHLPILVGGTGYYLKALLYSETFTSPNIQNHFLFPLLNILPVKVLKFIYKFLDTNSYHNLNHSEQNNPHRLVKRILLSLRARTNGRGNLTVETLHATSLQNQNILHINLDASTKYLANKIDQRIQSRLKAGLLSEITNLLKTYKFSDPGLNTLAYQEFQPYFQNKFDLQSCLDTWAKHEKQYVKRQKTYFHQLPKLGFNIETPNWQKQVQTQVKKWYNMA